MSVKRYSVGYKDSASGRYAAMLDKPDGGYVSHEDYAALEQKLAESQREFRAADATIENLQMQVEKLAAENAGLKAAHPQPFGPEMMKALDAYEKHQDETPETGMLDAFFILRDSIRVDTTATDAFLAEVRAQGAEMFASKCKEESKRAHSSDARDSWWVSGENAEDFAAQLRQEAAQ